MCPSGRWRFPIFKISKKNSPSSPVISYEWKHDLARSCFLLKKIVYNLGPKNIENMNKTTSTFGCLDLPKIGNLIYRFCACRLYHFTNTRAPKGLLWSLRLLPTENRGSSFSFHNFKRMIPFRPRQGLPKECHRNVLFLCFRHHELKSKM